MVEVTINITIRSLIIARSKVIVTTKIAEGIVGDQAWLDPPL